MLPRLVSWTVRTFSLFFPSPRTRFSAKCANKNMVVDNLPTKAKRRANFRLCNISSYTTEILEIHADDPSLHVLFVPGNPGVISFYKDFVEFLYELLEGSASVTAIGHISQTRKDWEHGRLFSLEEQINHKIDFIREELKNIETPILLVGHSIGSYISIEMLKRSPEKYHTMRNVLFMAMTEFRKLSETPDWAFMRQRQAQLAFLFGDDDHWGPLKMLEEILKQVPDVTVSVEREGHTHTFSCSEAGSLWVAQHVASLIKDHMASSNQ